MCSVECLQNHRQNYKRIKSDCLRDFAVLMQEQTPGGLRGRKYSLDSHGGDLLQLLTVCRKPERSPDLAECFRCGQVGHMRMDLRTGKMCTNTPTLQPEGVQQRASTVRKFGPHRQQQQQGQPQQRQQQQQQQQQQPRQQPRKAREAEFPPLPSRTQQQQAAPQHLAELEKIRQHLSSLTRAVAATECKVEETIVVHLKRLVKRVESLENQFAHHAGLLAADKVRAITTAAQPQQQRQLQPQEPAQAPYQTQKSSPAQSSQQSQLAPTAAPFVPAPRQLQPQQPTQASYQTQKSSPAPSSQQQQLAPTTAPARTQIAAVTAQRQFQLQPDPQRTDSKASASAQPTQAPQRPQLQQQLQPPQPQRADSKERELKSVTQPRQLQPPQPQRADSKEREVKSATYSTASTALPSTSLSTVPLRGNSTRSGTSNHGRGGGQVGRSRAVTALDDDDAVSDVGSATDDVVDDGQFDDYGDASDDGIDGWL